MKFETDQYLYKLTAALHQLEEEVWRAKKMFPENLVNQREGIAVLWEEVDELWDEIKKNQRDYDIQNQRKEAIQIAAMAMRFVVELT
jgi:NTP pyrophosphatase (non-canonical NTP hydrolase)